MLIPLDLPIYVDSDSDVTADSFGPRTTRTPPSKKLNVVLSYGISVFLINFHFTSLPPRCDRIPLAVDSASALGIGLELHVW